MMFPFKRVFPTAVVYSYLNISDAGKKSQIKISVLIFKIKIAGGGKTGWGYLVLGYIPASLEIKLIQLNIPTPQKKALGSVPYIGYCIFPKPGLVRVSRLVI